MGAFLEKVEPKVYEVYDLNLNYVKEILQKAKQRSNIKFMEKFKDVKDPYLEVGILIFPFIWYENCLLVLAEARATKTPITASNLGMIPKFYRRWKNSLLFDSFEPNNLNSICWKTDTDSWNPKNDRKNLNKHKISKKYEKTSKKRLRYVKKFCRRS